MQTSNYITSSVAILLATYNATKYLPELIDSLQKQSFKDWHLYVQDDLSSDGTEQMVKAYAENDSRIIWIENHEKKGAMKNFMDLLQQVDAPYYMFCDHDDVWLPRKVELTFNKMRETEEQHRGIPVVVHTDLKVVDGKLNEINPSFWKMSRIDPNLLRTFNDMAGHYLTTGCTMMINARAKEVSLPLQEGALMHDSWVTNRVMINGGVVTEVAEPTILYRQHGNNTIGAKDSQHNYLSNKLNSLGIVLRENTKYYHMLKCMGYGNFFKFLYYKLRYFVLYKK